MKEERLPISIDPVRFSKAKRVCHGRVKLSELPRLLESLAPGAEEKIVEAEMGFSVDEESRVVIEIKVKTVLLLVCQRCLGHFELPVIIQHLLAPVQGFDEAEKLPTHLDPCWLKEGVVSPLELVEEELLLAIPLVPMHDEKECENAGILEHLAFETQRSFSAESAGKEPRNLANPFSVLSDLKHK